MSMRARHLLILLALSLGGAAAGAPSPGGPTDRLEKYPVLGFGFERSSRLEARQVPPDAEELLLLFATKGAPNDRAAPCTQRVYRVEKPELDATGIRGWAQGLFPTADIDEERYVRARFGRKPVRLAGNHVVDGQKRSVFIHAWSGPKDAVVFVGECEESLYRRERRAFERAATSFRFFEQADVDLDRKDWETRYRRTILPFEAERIEIGVKLAEGWSVHDTESAMILFHGPKQSLVPTQLAKGMMAVRRRLTSDLPPDRKIRSLAVVRICRDRGEYLTYGGSPASVGYFNPGCGELVLYDARTDPVGAIPPDHPTVRTLYHEVCHQYLHQVMSAASPQTWFGEGLSEYYAGARIRSGRVIEIDPLEEQLEYLQRKEVRAKVPPLGELLGLSRAAFYANSSICYPYSYALIRFLQTSDEARARRSWSTLVERYFLKLREAWRDEVEELAFGGISHRAYEAAVVRSQLNALDAAFEGVDVPEMERAFWDWIARGEG